MRYEHSCRECDLHWAEDYSIHDEPPTECPECESTDVYRHVTSSGVVVFKGGGWSPQGYSKETAYEKHKADGHNIKLYDRKEDIDRDLKGEAGERELKRLKHEDRAAKRVFGSDAGVTQKEADRKIAKAKEEAV